MNDYYPLTLSGEKWDWDNPIFTYPYMAEIGIYYEKNSFLYILDTY